MKIYLPLCFILVLAACAPGPHDPREANEISGQVRMDVNSVVPEFFSREVHFAPGANLPDRMTGMDEAYGFTPEAVSALTIYAPAHDRLRDARVLALKREMRGLGIPSSRIRIASLPEGESGGYRIDYEYSHMETPPCGAWKGSEVANYDNVMQSEMGCAVAVNAGQMLADPRDLLHGSGNVRPEADRDTGVIQQYRANFDWNAAASGGSSNYSTSNAGPSAAVTAAGGSTGQ